MFYCEIVNFARNKCFCIFGADTPEKAENLAKASIKLTYSKTTKSVSFKKEFPIIECNIEGELPLIIKPVIVHEKPTHL